MENRSLVQGLWVGRGYASDSMRAFCGVMELFCFLSMVVVTQIYTCVEIHRPVYSHSCPQKSVLLYVNLKSKTQNHMCLLFKTFGLTTD